MEKREVANGERTETGKLTKQSAKLFLTLPKNKRIWSYMELEKLPWICFPKVQEN